MTRPIALRYFYHTLQILVDVTDVPFYKFKFSFSPPPLSLSYTICKVLWNIPAQGDLFSLKTSVLGLPKSVISFDRTRTHFMLAILWYYRFIANWTRIRNGAVLQSWSSMRADRTSLEKPAFYQIRFNINANRMRLYKWQMCWNKITLIMNYSLSWNISFITLKLSKLFLNEMWNRFRNSDKFYFKEGVFKTDITNILSIAPVIRVKITCRVFCNAHIGLNIPRFTVAYNIC